MTNELQLRVEAPMPVGRMIFAALPGLKKKMIDFATEVQKRLGLPNDERFLLWRGLAGTYYEQCHLHIVAELYRRERDWVPGKIKNSNDIAFVGEEICRVYDIEGIPKAVTERGARGYVLNLTYCAEPIPYEEAIEHIVNELK